MPSANINDLKSLEQLYGFEAFERDAAQNGLSSTTVLRGLRITALPGADGGFEITPAKRHAGETEPEPTAAFVPAMLAQATPGMEKAPDDRSRRRLDYEGFLKRVVETAQGIRLRPDDGTDQRLKGFHGG